MFTFELEDLVDVKTVTVLKQNGKIICHEIINEGTVDLLNELDNIQIIIDKENDEVN